MHTANVSSSVCKSFFYPVKARAVFFLLLCTFLLPIVCPPLGQCSVCSVRLFVLLFLLLSENQDLWFILTLRWWWWWCSSTAVRQIITWLYYSNGATSTCPIDRTWWMLSPNQTEKYHLPHGCLIAAALKPMSFLLATKKLVYRVSLSVNSW